MFARLVYISLGVCVIGATALAQTSPSVTGSTRQAPATREPVGRTEKINLNTAPVSELVKLPHLSVRAVTAITEARTKSKFKDWNDFVGRRVVPRFVRSEIKDLVTF
ncbi:helix-hairpin-helix domain-containing protein [Bradyrhizobium sp. CER78]|uniref:ComEA family DNA-binding protein n=1 Tax=Bradyrhizobium sp. CER78 TaxID=3039162 RepID=UPI00244B048A|nr:helix-hairpin-helix domain-containing protein [Bradyrhizobium sp. CER78]MDH2383908.1 helix-hairpin-helix domain-containing protein [Bradyrhizobium sp. CER78]